MPDNCGIHTFLTASTPVSPYNDGVIDPLRALLQIRPQSSALSLAAPRPGRVDFAALLSSFLAPSIGTGPGPASSFPGMARAGGLDSLNLLLALSLLEKLDRPGIADSAPAGVPVPSPGSLPVQGRLTQGFHPRHNGVDLAVPPGTPVQSTMDGKVTFAGWNDQGYGYLVIVENGPVRTYYAHLRGMPPVEPGQAVTAGTRLGLSGSSGNSTGPHVHYEVRVNGEAVSPWDFSELAATLY